MDESYMRILKAISMNEPSFTTVFPVLGNIGMDENELGVKLEALAKWGLIQVERDSYVPGITLPNGILSIGLTGFGRQLLISQQ
jgi:hypothetical protein